MTSTSRVSEGIVMHATGKDKNVAFDISTFFPPASLLVSLLRLRFTSNSFLLFAYEHEEE